MAVRNMIATDSDIASTGTSRTRTMHIVINVVGPYYYYATVLLFYLCSSIITSPVLCFTSSSLQLKHQQQKNCNYHQKQKQHEHTMITYARNFRLLAGPEPSNNFMILQKFSKLQLGVRYDDDNNKKDNGNNNTNGYESTIGKRMDDVEVASVVTKEAAVGSAIASESVVGVDRNDYLEQKILLERAVQRIDQIKGCILTKNNSSGEFYFRENGPTETLPSTIRLSSLPTSTSVSTDDISKLERTIIDITSVWIPPAGMSQDEYIHGIVTFIKLPFIVRWIICEALTILITFEENENVKSTTTSTTSTATKLEQSASTPKRLWTSTMSSMDAATNFEMVPEIVQLLYQYSKNNRLTCSIVAEAVQNIKSKQKVKLTSDENNFICTVSATISEQGNINEVQVQNTNQQCVPSITTNRESGLRSIFSSTSTSSSATTSSGGIDEYDSREEAAAKIMLGRVATQTNERGESTVDIDLIPDVPTEQDLQLIVSVLDQGKVFNRSGKPVKIPGGYMIRGTVRSKKITGDQLIEVLDTQLHDFTLEMQLQQKKQASRPGTQMSSSNPTVQLCYILDFTIMSMLLTAVEGVQPEPILVLLRKEMSPSSTFRLLKILSSTAAVLTCIAFAIDAYGSNEAIKSILSSSSSNGGIVALPESARTWMSTDTTTTTGTTGIDFFKGKLLEILIPIACIQLVHDTGHWIIASRDKLKVTLVPLLVPLWKLLPFMGSQIRFKESPKNVQSLFDFASIGPFVGMVLSSIVLVVGLQQTVTASKVVSQYFPSLPVKIINLSALGAYIIDYYFGGTGFVSYQDPTTTIPLHPLAIAGFTSLLINALALLPLGASDGGRMSLAIFGRKGHSLLGATVWLALLLASIFVENSGLLAAAWIVYNFVEGDPEIPCRNEVDKLDLVRSFFGFALWFIAILTLVPIL